MSVFHNLSIFQSSRSYRHGFSVVEIIVAAAIIVTLVTSAASVWTMYFRVSRTSHSDTQASLLTEEAAEALNYYRDMSWSTYISHLNLNTPYYIYWNDSYSKYSTSTTPVLINNAYYVSLIFSVVYRDPTSGDITNTVAPIDNHTSRVSIFVYASSSPSVALMQSTLLLHDIYHQ